MSPIKTVFMYYSSYAFATIFLMTLLSILAFRALRQRFKKGETAKEKYISGWILITYSEILLYFTVFGRRALDYYRYNFDLGYSYKEVFLFGDYTLASQIIINIVIFIPIGGLCGVNFMRHKLRCSCFYGLFMSCIIELLQLVLRRGYCEFDDLISNLMGTLIGFFFWMCFKKVLKYRIA